MRIMQDSPLDYPLLARGKMRDLYDPGDNLSTVDTDRFSSLDETPCELISIPGEILDFISAFLFEQPSYIHSEQTLSLLLSSDPMSFNRLVSNFDDGS